MISTQDIQISFQRTFHFLIFSAIITFLATLFFTNPSILRILRLETLICIVAAFFYFIFVERVNESKTIHWDSLIKIRYADWVFTTPMMLASLAYFLSTHSNIAVTVGSLVVILGFNYLMLLFGYLGEINVLPHFWGMVLGFLLFFAMFYLLSKYLKNNMINRFVLGIYFLLWSMYGIVYMFSPEQKNLITNWLDLIAKGVVGTGFAIYFFCCMRK